MPFSSIKVYGASGYSGYSGWAPGILTATVSSYSPGTVSTDASLGNSMQVTVTATGSGTVTLSTPSSPTNGQKFVWSIYNNAASAGVVTISASWLKYGNEITSITTVANGKTDYLGCIYNTNTGTSGWHLVSYATGY